MPPFLSDAIFVGHLVTDMDSIAGAIGAAELYGQSLLCILCSTPSICSAEFLINSLCFFLYLCLCLHFWSVLGGIAARASEVNSETDFCLKYWGVNAPPPIEETLLSYPSAGVCLVDHQQMSQLNKSIDLERIVGVIDHHALQNATIVTDKPIYIDIRPWGSMSSIIAHNFFSSQIRPSKSTAGMLLCAILSDTLNLMGIYIVTYLCSQYLLIFRYLDIF